MQLPRRWGPFVYGVIQAALTTAVATAIATYPLASNMMVFVKNWTAAWGISWLMMLPVVLLLAPFIQRAVLALTVDDEKPALTRR